MDYITTPFYKACVFGVKAYYQYTHASIITTSQDEVLHIDSRDPGRTIKTHVYRPATPHEHGPVLLNLHGSGFVFPAHGTDDDFCRLVSQQTNYTVLDMQYRLAPEHPFPAAVNDMEDVVKWVLEQSAVFDLNHFSICGFSAGGNLALVGASCSFPRGTYRSVLAFYPPTDLATDPAAKVQPDPAGTPIPAFLARCFDRAYIPAGADPKNPSISPTYAPAENFPDNVLVITAAYDNLATEAEALAEKIKDEPGKSVSCHRMEKCGHAFDKSPKPGSVEAKATDESYARAIEMLKK